MTDILDQQQLRDLVSTSALMLRLQSVEEVCQLTAESVVKYSLFKRCVVSILDLDNTFDRLGFGGLSSSDVEKLRTLPKSSISDMEQKLLNKFRIGRSFYIPSGTIAMQGLASSKAPVDEGWHPEDFLFIPLYDPDQRIVGIISIDDPEDGKKPTIGKLLPLELFATQIAAVLENLRNVRKQEEIIKRLTHQQEVVMELSTPVIQVWDKIIALPLIGSVDSARAQQIMENVLVKINETEASVIIIDITGVPVIDTLVASHLIKTVAAAKLLGSQSIITGINPEIAQTLVHLGVDLSGIVTKSNLAKGINAALKITGKYITDYNTKKL